MEKTYLNVCQGNISAKRIATILSSNCFTTRANELYEFSSNIHGEKVKMIMTSTPGHLLSHELPSGSWEATDPILLFDKPTKKTYSFYTQKIIEKLLEEVSNCCGLIIWTENNREGDNIGFEIIDICKTVKTKESDLKTYRAKFDRITQQSIENALNHLQEPDRKISDALDVRKEIDLKTGAAFTRLHTLVIRHVFTNIEWPIPISYGSCQFPTLNFVVERYKQYQEFIGIKQKEIKLKHIANDVVIEFHCKRETLGEQDILLGICEKTPIIGTVESVEKKRIKLQRPLALNTFEMVKKITKTLKITATVTLKIADWLYENGLISYPFTRQNIFANDINLQELLQHQKQDAEMGRFAEEILNNGGPDPRISGNIFVFDQDHLPIYPTAYTNNLSGDEERVYKFIVKHFLACLQKDAFAEETTIHANIAGEAFEAKVLTILDKNCLYIDQSWNDKEIYNYQEGETLTFTSEMVDCRPPFQLLTEADLMVLMEKHRIGTICTYNRHINKIKDNKYIRLNDDLTVVPTPLGVGLIEGYKEMDLDVCLTDPNCRTEFEMDIKSICDGEEDPLVIRSKYIKEYKDVYKEVESKIWILCETLSKHLRQEYKPILKCPHCNNDMIYNMEKTRPKYISCIRFPICYTAIWFNTQPETMDVLDEICSDCEIAKKIKVKYEENILPARYTNPYTFCVYCCDEQDWCSLNINKKDIAAAVNSKWKKIKLDLSSS